VQRVVVIGVPGSGKSTLARRLAPQIAAPVVELDQLYWLPGWSSRPPEEFRALTDLATTAERWIVVGNYGVVRDIVWPRADTVIWLDYGLGRCLGQLLIRCVRRVVTQESICNGNHESWRKLVSRDSIALWLLTPYWRRRREYPARLDGVAYPNLCAIHLRSPREAERWLKAVAAEAAIAEPPLTARSASPGA
jgi:adenylate kinase family enzyme